MTDTLQQRLPEEHCCVCDALTGRAGRADDSLYLETQTGEELGPLCEDCHNSFRRDDLTDALVAKDVEIAGLGRRLDAALLVNEEWLSRKWVGMVARIEELEASNAE